LDIDLVSEEKYYLEKVSRVLNYQLSSSILLFLTYAWGITILLTIIAAAIFAPFMIYAFFKAKKTSWVISFFIIVVVPIIICIILGLRFGNLFVVALIPLGFFYFYCFILKLIVNDQLEEVKAKEELQRERDKEQGENLLY
jgi:fatty acid desaturase